MKKLPAFSLPDLIVTMVVSTIVVGTAFTVFRFTYGRIFHYKSANDDYKQLYQLYTVMQDDFQRAATLTYTGNEVQMPAPASKKCSYLFSETAIIRRTEADADTFFVDIQNISPLFNGVEQSNGVIDELNFTIAKGNAVLPYKFVKEYSAEMNMEFENTQ